MTDKQSLKNKLKNLSKNHKSLTILINKSKKDSAKSANLRTQLMTLNLEIEEVKSSYEIYTVDSDARRQMSNQLRLILVSVLIIIGGVGAALALLHFQEKNDWQHPPVNYGPYHQIP